MAFNERATRYTEYAVKTWFEDDFWCAQVLTSNGNKCAFIGRSRKSRQVAMSYAIEQLATELKDIILNTPVDSW